MALERLRAEARKCVLLCANCHAEVEAGMVSPTDQEPATYNREAPDPTPG
jgi:hypothetical protein